MTDFRLHGYPGLDVFIPFQQVAPGTPVVKEGQKLPKAFTPLTIRGVTFQNRVWVSPMCQYSYEDGFISDWTLVAIGSYAVRGAALSMIEATAVSPKGRITPWDAGLWKDEHIHGVKRVAEFVHAHNQKLGIQLGHAGRLGSTRLPWLPAGPQPEDQDGFIPLAPSPGAFSEKNVAPREITLAEIEEVVTNFRKAAVRAVKAGVDVIEIHCAHGYLLNEFLSPITNKRTDKYGGSFENRVRIVKEVVSAIKGAIPEKILLFIRVSGSDRLEYKNEGLVPEDYVKILKELQPLGIDLVDVSSGGNTADGKIEYRPGFQAPFGYIIKQGLPSLLVSSVGSLHSKEIIDEALGKGLDAVFVGRPWSHDPSYLIQLAAEYDVEVQWPLQIGYTQKYSGPRGKT